MTLAEAIYQHSLKLPERAAREALDFIEFLEQRYRADIPGGGQLTETQVEALARLSKVRIAFGGKPMPDREEANARG